MGRFLRQPRPYFTLKDGNDNVVYTSSTVDDAGSATWTGLNVVLNNPPYAVDFYDEDLFDGDDWLGWAPFTPNGPGTISIDANPSNAQLTIGLDPVVTVVDAAELVVYPLPEVGIVLDGDDGVACPNDSLLQYSWSCRDRRWPEDRTRSICPNRVGGTPSWRWIPMGVRRCPIPSCFACPMPACP